MELYSLDNNVFHKVVNSRSIPACEELSFQGFHTHIMIL